jgi:serine/threonine protein kinase
MDKFIEEGVDSDIWFPFTTRSLPGCLGVGQRERFVNSQHMVDTDVLYLEKNSKSEKQCKHVHFTKEEDAPFIQIGRLGKGGFGVVHKVQSKISHKFYARKKTPRNRIFLQTKEEIIAFKREREAMVKLSHHHCIEFVSLICLYKL